MDHNKPSELKLSYKQNTSFWRTKLFLFSLALISFTVLGCFMYFAINEIHCQGEVPNKFYNLFNTSQDKNEKLVNLEYRVETPVHFVQKRIKRLDDATTPKTELTSATLELNYAIKELNDEIKRFYENLSRLNDRVVREKRGLDEQAAIVDCVQMKGSFKKIYEDLNRISETLSMIDENGKCRCKCPSDTIIGSAADVTDLPMELTTFALNNIIKLSNSSEKTKQLKKVILSDYMPQSAENKFKSVTDKKDTGTTVGKRNEFTTVRALGTDLTTTAHRDADIVTETKEDMSPEMSNAVTNLLNLDGFTQTAGTPTDSYYYSDVVTKNYGDVQIVTSETLKTPTDETVDMTALNYDDEMTTVQEEISVKEFTPSVAAESEDVSKSTIDTPESDKYVNSVSQDDSEPTTENDGALKSTVTLLDFDKNENDFITEEPFQRWTITDDDVLKSTTEVLDFDKNDVKNERSESTTANGNVSESPVQLSNVNKSTIKSTTRNTPQSTEKTSDFDTNYGRTEVYKENKNAGQSTTAMVISNRNENNTKERRTPAEYPRDKNDEDKPKVEVGNRPKFEKTNAENENGTKLQNHDIESVPKGTGTTQQVVQPKWYPICFYPVPCSPDTASRRQNSQDTSKTATQTIQYSAQSLNAYKKNAPIAGGGATVIQNSYPIISYCPMGMVCPTADFAGQANMLHCMMQSSAPALSPETPVRLNKTDGNASNQTVKSNRDDDGKSPAVAMIAKNARDSEEILTGDLDCPPNTYPCMDNSRCIDTENWCDGRIHCNDASDESQCNCKERIDKDKLCDGYYDCPSGEDELGCFGCNNETFSCGDWNTITQSTSCFERINRCDYVKNCPNGRDEDECTLLSRHLENPNQIFFISYATGYLHHNWKGNWYPVCGDDQIEKRAENACSVESGERSKPNKIQYVNEPTAYDGPYINIDGNNRITLMSGCSHQGILVECEPETCGTRSELKFNKNIDPDRIRRSPYSESSDTDNATTTTATSRFARSKDPRVVGGIASNPGAWPWLIALYQDGIFHCGGVILSDQWVLTAAHCVNQYQKHFYEVQAGILRRFSFSPMEQSRTVTHVMIHTQYMRTTMENDLAVLRLERSLEFNRWIRPVCLPDRKLNWIPFPGTICTAVGWGATVEHGPDPDNMREVEVPILPECTHKSDVDGKEICAGYLSGGHDTCQGDSGGPLLCREPNNLNKWYVAGIVSHGEGCARPMEPGVYTRVALYMDWIIQVTDDTNLPSDRPQQYCPGIRCKTGKQCVPTKRQCDKYVDCMNAEDEQNCDYTGTQYHVSLYRSRNTDRSNLKYSKSKGVGESRDDREMQANVTTTTTTAGPTSHSTVAIFQNAKHDVTPLPNDKNTAAAAVTVRYADAHVENRTIDVRAKSGNNDASGRLNETVLDAIRQLFDNQFTEETFSCARITQVVLSNHRCDGTVDCEDGSDEQRCDCKTRLASVYGASAICDGVVDCDDGMDETGCGASKCEPDETVCGRPKICVKKTAWCDGVVDCNGDEMDEKYCMTITNGTTAVEMDATGRPALRRSGMVAVNRNGVWKPMCADQSTAIKIAHDICSSLHFTDSTFYEKRMVWNKPLPLNEKELRLADVCQGLYVKCGPARTTVDGKLYHWHADVMVDGRIVQSGVLIEDSWVLARKFTTPGFSLDSTYVTAVLGGGSHSSVWIKSPYEQIARVDAIARIPGTDLDLLHLASPADVSRGVAPLGVPLFQPSVGANDTCYAIRYADDNDVSYYRKTETAVLRADRKRRCDDNALCLAVSRKPRSCDNNPNGKDTSHETAIVCESSNFGLFLAAPTVQRNMNFCHRNARVQLATTEDLMNEIAAIIEKNVKPSPVPICNGIRCELGQCVPWEKVCDGVPNCRDEQDETIEMCQTRTNKCKSNNTLCICEVGSFRCANGGCVQKTAFCNGIDDCGDGTDEPETCQKNSCVDYLKLTAPERLCDGRWDCLDKTDEEFMNCPAGYCNRTNVYQCQSSNKCISTELVCDGEEDCPESDDEAECMGLIMSPKKKNEGVLATRSYGSWHAQCITEDYTDVDYHSLCRGLGFKHAVGIRKTDGAKVNFENFTIVQLNNSTDVAVRSATKNILQYTDRSCAATYVVCSSAT